MKPVHGLAGQGAVTTVVPRAANAVDRTGQARALAGLGECHARLGHYELVLGDLGWLDLLGIGARFEQTDVPSPLG